MLVIGLEGTQRFARTLADMLLPGDCVALRGDLGAGKTAFAETMIQHLYGGNISVISPTFNVLQTYDIEWAGEPTTLWHYDLYRLEKPEELQELGLEDAFELGITLIEWPEIAEHWLPRQTFDIAIEFSEHNSNRDIRLAPPEARREQAGRAGLC